MDELKDKVVLITGAGKGSGRILAEAFAQRDTIVAANDISPINVEAVTAQIVAKGGRAKSYVDDVAKKVAAQNIVNQVQDDFGRIDILINHAAVEPHVPLLDMDEWDWHRVLDVNLTGTFLMTQSVGRVMRVQASGVIINLTHTAALRRATLVTGSTRDESNVAAFLASMQGLAGFTRQAARELNPYGIQVHLVESGAEKVVEKVFGLLYLHREGQ